MLTKVLKLPLLQPAQLRSLVASPPPEINCPGPQSLWRVQLLALSAALNEPDGQSTQTRSWSAPPIWLTYVPAAHAAQTAHAGSLMLDV